MKFDGQDGFGSRALQHLGFWGAGVLGEGFVDVGLLGLRCREAPRTAARSRV